MGRTGSRLCNPQVGSSRPLGSGLGLKGREPSNMIHRFANDQSLVATNTTILNTYSDPIAVGDDTNACDSLFLHYLQFAAGNTAKLRICVETSNDSVYWDNPAAAARK